MQIAASGRSTRRLIARFGVQLMLHADNRGSGAVADHPVWPGRNSAAALSSASRLAAVRMPA